MLSFFLFVLAYVKLPFDFHNIYSTGLAYQKQIETIFWCREKENKAMVLQFRIDTRELGP